MLRNGYPVRTYMAVVSAILHCDRFYGCSTVKYKRAVVFVAALRWSGTVCCVKNRCSAASGDRNSCSVSIVCSCNARCCHRKHFKNLCSAFGTETTVNGKAVCALEALQRFRSTIAELSVNIAAVTALIQTGLKPAYIIAAVTDVEISAGRRS